jgi:diguanylate cyclase (GGDEF)-like protein
MTNITQDDLQAALRRCESEPIHLIGQIQSRGMLLVLGEAPERLILQASDNIARFFDAPLDTVLGQPLERLIHADQTRQIEQLLGSAEPGSEIKLVRSVRIYSHFPHTSVQLQVYGHKVGSLAVLEIEPYADTATASRINDDIASEFHNGLWNLAGETDPQKYFTRVAEIVRQISGFDRAMVYRFEPNWDGEVMAEARNDMLPSYLGNRFPAGDIPPQARSLYTQNLVRMVTDIEVPTAKLVPALNPVTHAPLDMSQVKLRSFSPVHVEYLRNMDVRASLSISLLQNGRLWGLIACHSKEPATPPFHVVEFLELISRLVSMWLSAIESKEREMAGAQLSGILAKLLKSLSRQTDEQPVPAELLQELFGLVNASGMVLVSSGSRLSLGDTPTPDQLDGLLAWLETQPKVEIFHTHELSERFAPAAEYAEKGSGLLVIQSPHGMNQQLLWFRSERIREVRWAGSPEKTVVKERDSGLRISPRSSFSSWTETWHWRSEFWSSRDIELVEILSHAISLALARNDDLTGLPRRSTFSNRIRQAIARAERNHTLFALVFIDIDNFKPVNDNYGHAAGDACLKQVTQQIKSHLRGEDTVARWGGDEFVVLMEDIASTEFCLLAAERLCRELRSPFQIGEITISVSASIGVVVYPEVTGDEDQLITKADAAMYQAKQRGGNCIVVHDRTDGTTV